MNAERLTENIWCTRYGASDKPKLVVGVEATDQERALIEVLETLGIWEIIFEPGWSKQSLRG